MSDPQPPIVIDCHYAGHEGVAAAFLIREGDRAAFIETNTSLAVPRLLHALDEAGLQPEQVDWIVITHVHLDHAGGAAALMAACPNATLLAHPRAAPHAIDPTRLVQSALPIYGEAKFKALYGDVSPVDASRVRIMGDGETMTFGARTWTFLHTLGHAKHHFCIHDSKLDAVFTGDSFGIIYPALQDHHRLAFPSTPPTDFDPVEAHRSVDRIVATGASHVYNTHCGAYSGLTVIAEQLHRHLDLFTRWVQEAFDADIPDDALDAHFFELMRGHFDDMLTQHGLLDDDPRRALLQIDTSLNAQGLAFAVKKMRYKRAKAAGTLRDTP